MARKKTSKKKNKRSSMKNKVKKRAQAREGSTGGGWINTETEIEYFNPKKGRNTFDILPYEVTVDTHPEAKEGELWYQRTVWVHYGIGAEEKSYICPAKTIGKPCPICKHLKNLNDPDEVKDLKAKERELFNIKNDDDEIQLMTLSYHLFGKQLEEEIRECDDEYAGFAELEGGYTVKARFKEEKIGRNKYLEVSRIDFVERDDLDEDILDEVQNLDEILNILDYKTLEKIYWEADEPDNDDDDEEDDEKPKNKKSKSKKTTGKKKKSEPESDEDDKDEDDGNEDNDSECPYDHSFGEDCNEHEECDDCDEWEDCQDAFDLIEKEKSKKSKKKKK